MYVCISVVGRIGIHVHFANTVVRKELGFFRALISRNCFHCVRLFVEIPLYNRDTACLTVRPKVVLEVIVREGRTNCETSVLEGLGWFSGVVHSICCRRSC